MSKVQRPEKVRLGTQRTTYAIAYAHHPPSKNKPEWSWRILIDDPLSGKQIRIALGRLPRERVLPKMRIKYQEHSNETILPSVRVATVKELMLLWFEHCVFNRGPNSKLRPEYRLSKYTVRSYESYMKSVVAVAGKVRLKDLNPKRVQQIRLKLQERYAPRTIHQCIARLSQAIAWGRKNGMAIPEFEIENRRPSKGKGYTSNRVTPTHQEVAGLLEQITHNPLKLAVYIGWKTGARTGEVTTLCWKDIFRDAQGCWISLNGKTGERLCPIGEEEYEFILGFRGKAMENSRVFSKGYHGNVSTMLKETCIRLGVREFTFYGLRRLRVDTLQRQGVEPAVYEKIMGHSLRMAQDIYRNPNAADLQGVLQDREKVVSKEVGEGALLQVLIDRLGLSMEEALRRLIGD